MMWLGIGQILQAQTFNKNALLAELNNAGNAKLSGDQKNEFNKLNQKYVDEFFEMDKNSKSKEDRDKAIDDLFDRRDKEIDDLFGLDDAYKDLKKELKRNTKGMRRKVKLAKLML